MTVVVATKGPVGSRIAWIPISPESCRRGEFLAEDKGTAAGPGDAGPGWSRPVRPVLSGFSHLLHAVVSQRYLWVPFALTFLYLVGAQAYVHGLDFASWDVLLLAGWATLIGGLLAVRAVPKRMHQTLQRLVHRRTLDLEEAELPALIQDLEVRGMRWGARAGVVVAVLIVTGFIAAYGSSLPPRLPLMTLETVAGYVAGVYLGRMASYGSLGRFLRDRGCAIKVWPGHVDGAAGLKPLGDFYFYQAMIAAIPAAFLAAAWLLIPLKGDRYAYWREPYLGLLVPAIAFEVLAFVVPLWWFHRQMERSKTTLLQEADQLSVEILAHHSPAAEGSDEPDESQLDVERAKERYFAIENMPTWPVDVRTRRKFRLNNLALIVPWIGQAVGKTALGRQIAELLRSIS